MSVVIYIYVYGFTSGRGGGHYENEGCARSVCLHWAVKHFRVVWMKLLHSPRAEGKWTVFTSTREDTLVSLQSCRLLFSV